MKLNELLTVALSPKQAQIAERLDSLWDAVKEAKPNDRSDLDRSYAIFVTDLEKVLSYWFVHIALPESVRDAKKAENDQPANS